MMRSGSILFLGLTACASSGSRAADQAELLTLHEEQRTAHLEKRADLLVASQADSLISISRGNVSVTDSAAVRAMFQSYFDQVEFHAWDDAAPPIVRISPDGQMAYVIVQKRVHLSPADSTKSGETERTMYAWLAVYEKRDGNWRMTAIASTDRPDRN